MAKASDLKGLVEGFAAQIEQHVAAKLAEQIQARFNDLKSALNVSGGGASRPSSSKGAKVVVARKGKPGPKPGYKVDPKPCPICGKPSKARRFSYLCDDHRGDEFLAKVQGKGAAKAAPKAKAAKKAGKKKG